MPTEIELEWVRMDWAYPRTILIIFSRGWLKLLTSQNIRGPVVKQCPINTKIAP